MINRVFRLLSNIVTRKVTLKQAYYIVLMRFHNAQKELGDEFDWNLYPHHYKEELKSVSRVATLVLKPGEFAVADGVLRQCNENILPLVASHHLLYEVVVGLGQGSVLEIGCGGGDHLHNLHVLDPQLELFGVDRSNEQLNTLRERHPGLPAVLALVDITEPTATLPIADIVYTQAVLMHISEKKHRFRNALANVLRAARSHVVLVENWAQHEFLTHLREAVSASPDWTGARFYYARCSVEPSTRCLILSKQALKQEELTNYDSLLQGEKMWPR